MRSGVRTASQRSARFSPAATQLSWIRSMSGNGRLRRISKRTRGFTCSQNSVIVCDPGADTLPPLISRLMSGDLKLSVRSLNELRLLDGLSVANFAEMAAGGNAPRLNQTSSKGQAAKD